MKIKLLIFCIFLTQQINAQSYQKIHQKAILVDSHNDILMKAVDNGLVFDKNLKGKAQVLIENIEDSYEISQSAITQFQQELKTKRLIIVKVVL